MDKKEFDKHLKFISDYCDDFGIIIQMRVSTRGNRFLKIIEVSK